MTANNPPAGAKPRRRRVRFELTLGSDAPSEPTTEISEIEDDYTVYEVMTVTFTRGQENEVDNIADDFLGACNSILGPTATEFDKRAQQYLDCLDFNKRPELARFRGYSFESKWRCEEIISTNIEDYKSDCKGVPLWKVLLNTKPEWHPAHKIAQYYWWMKGNAKNLAMDDSDPQRPSLEHMIETWQAAEGLLVEVESEWKFGPEIKTLRAWQKKSSSGGKTTAHNWNFLLSVAIEYAEKCEPDSTIKFADIRREVKKRGGSVSARTDDVNKYIREQITLQRPDLKWTLPPKGTNKKRP